jgi:hypothetical protein
MVKLQAAYLSTPAKHFNRFTTAFRLIHFEEYGIRSKNVRRTKTGIQK